MRICSPANDVRRARPATQENHDSTKAVARQRANASPGPALRPSESLPMPTTWQWKEGLLGHEPSPRHWALAPGHSKPRSRRTGPTGGRSASKSDAQVWAIQAKRQARRARRPWVRQDRARQLPASWKSQLKPASQSVSRRKGRSHRQDLRSAAVGAVDAIDLAVVDRIVESTCVRTISRGRSAFDPGPPEEAAPPPPPPPEHHCTLSPQSSRDWRSSSRGRLRDNGGGGGSRSVGQWRAYFRRSHRILREPQPMLPRAARVPRCDGEVIAPSGCSFTSRASPPTRRLTSFAIRSPFACKVSLRKSSVV